MRRVPYLLPSPHLGHGSHRNHAKQLPCGPSPWHLDWLRRAFGIDGCLRFHLPSAATFLVIHISPNRSSTFYQVATASASSKMLSSFMVPPPSHSSGRDLSPVKHGSAPQSSLCSAQSQFHRHISPHLGPRRALSHRNNRNCSLLRYSGPLESMLKTTETGDIGLFTIDSQSPSSPSCAVPRSRPRVGEVNALYAARPVPSNRFYSRDDRRRLPSFRAEIVSPNGSGTIRPQPHALSPSAEVERRQYSRTNCSSARRSAFKSPGTLRNCTSRAIDQRSRSPFSYPTPLKRHGACPSSPHQTETGVSHDRNILGFEKASHVRNSLHEIC